MKIALIVAMAQNRVIGRQNQLPWHLPGDLQHFKRLTIGKPIIMGRKTFDSIGRPLPQRDNIVITRQPNWDRQGILVAHNVEQAIKLAKQTLEASDCAEKKAAEVMIIGGAQLYKETLPLAEKIYLTQVHADVEGDACFPTLLDKEWCELSREDYICPNRDSYNYSFLEFVRVT